MGIIGIKCFESLKKVLQSFQSLIFLFSFYESNCKTFFKFLQKQLSLCLHFDTNLFFLPIIFFQKSCWVDVIIISYTKIRIVCNSLYNFYKLFICKSWLEKKKYNIITTNYFHWSFFFFVKRSYKMITERKLLWRSILYKLD